MTQESTSRLDRRTVLKTVGLLAVAGAGTGLGVSAFTGRASASIPDFTIDGDTVTTDDGTLTDIKLRASGTWQFDGIDGPVSGVKIGLSAHRPGSAHAQGYTVSTQQIPIEGDPAAASGTFDLEWASLPFDGHYFYDLSDFTAGADGTSKTTPIVAYLWMEVHEFGWQTNYALDDLGGPAMPGHGPARETQFNVTVTNQEATGSVAGTGEADAQGVNEYPLGEGDVGELGLTWSTGSCAWRVDNRNPVGTAPIAFTIQGVGGDGSVDGVAPAGHYGYPVADGPGGHDPHGTFADLDTPTAKLIVDGQQVAVKARGGCTQ
jgi:hypothetical protein